MPTTTISPSRTAGGDDAVDRRHDRVFDSTSLARVCCARACATRRAAAVLARRARSTAAVPTAPGRGRCRPRPGRFEVGSRDSPSRIRSRLRPSCCSASRARASATARHRQRRRGPARRAPRSSASSARTCAAALEPSLSACTGSIRASICPAFTRSPSATGRLTILPMTLEPMSAYREATISPDAVTVERNPAYE